MKALVLALCLALPMSAIAADHRGRSWQEIINDSSLNKTPSAAQIQKFSTSAVKAASGPQTFLVADRFLFLFDSDGSAVVTFDLTMDDIGIKDMIMGAVGIGQFSVEGIFKLFRDIFEKPTKLADGKAKGVYARADGKIAESWADMDAHTFLKTSDQNIEDGYKAFAKLEFADRWIAKSGQKSMTGEQRAGYQPADFTLGDLYVKPELRAQAEELFNRISIVLFKATLAEMGGLEQFTDQFQMKWDADKQQFNMLWAPSKQAKRPELPGWVVNYAYPTDTLAYKLSLNQVERLVSSADLLFGKYGAVAAILVSRVTNSIKARLDSHENSLLTFLEGAAAGTYDLGMPLQDADAFIDGTSLLLYLAKLEGSDDITDAEAKRANILKYEAKNREENLAWFEKHGFEAKLWPDQRSATIYKKGKRVGVASVAIEDVWLLKWQSWHHYDALPFAKTAGRLGLEVFTDAVRFIVPSAVSIPLPYISISLYIPGAIWDMIFRGRSFTEIGYEGFVISQVNSALAGKWEVPGYTAEELEKMKFWLYAQRTNPYEVSKGRELRTMDRNMRLVDQFLGGGLTKNDFQLFDARLQNARLP
jgi:hypothetical protein